MAEVLFKGWIALVALSLGTWRALSSIAPGNVSLLAGCYNLSKLVMISTIVLTVLPARIPFLINICLTTAFGILILLLDGHLRVLRHKKNPEALKAVQQGLRPDLATLPINYCVFLLGSGGHTREMCSMIRKQFPPSPNMHRRYVITSGDNYSAGVLTQLEQTLKADVGADKAGTYDCYMVKRSRRVHQKWFSAVWSTLDSINSLMTSLTTRPQGRPGTKWSAPNVVVTNGPGTGFILCMLAHLLKVLYMAPQGSLKIVYVESLARVKTLSLTGKLFHLTNIADVFLVQHPGLARRYGKTNGGFMVETRREAAQRG